MTTYAQLRKFLTDSVSLCIQQVIYSSKAILIFVCSGMANRSLGISHVLNNALLKEKPTFIQQNEILILISKNIRILQFVLTFPLLAILF